MRFTVFKSVLSCIFCVLSRSVFLFLLNTKLFLHNSRPANVIDQNLDLWVRCQSMSPLSIPLIITSADAIFVATGILCISQRRSSSFDISFRLDSTDESRKKITTSTSSYETREVICWTPPWDPGSRHSIWRPVASETILPVFPVAQIFCLLSIPQYAIQSWLRSSFFYPLQLMRFPCEKLFLSVI